MIVHVDGEADLFTVLSRLSGSYSWLAGNPSVPLAPSGSGDPVHQ